MRRTMFVFAIFLGSVGFSNANWGGSSNGSVATGEFRPVGTDHVEIQNEELKIDLYHGKALVSVSYVMKNMGGPIEVKGGFPSIVNSVKDDWSEYKEISDYCITADGMKLSYNNGGTATIDWIKVPCKMPYVDFVDAQGAYVEVEDEPRPLKVKWLVSTLKFKANEIHKVNITYVSNYLEEGGGSNDGDEFEPRYFRYLLSTGSVWKGPIRKGRITIRAMSVDADRLIVEPKDKFKRKDNVYTWSFSDLKPDVSDNIVICLNDDFQIYCPEEKGPNQYKRFVYRYKPMRCFEDVADYDVFSSSDRALEYQVKNISYRGYRDLEQPWVAGGQNNGIGESVTFIFRNPRKISEVGIAPGFIKSEKLYKANNRPCSIQLTIDESTPIECILGDDFRNLCHSCGKEDWDYQWLELNPSRKRVRKIIMKILSVYKGKQYCDTCISGVIFREKLDRDPDSRPPEQPVNTPDYSKPPVAKPMKKPNR